MQTIMSSLEGVELKEKRGGVFRFTLHLTAGMRGTLMEDLDLSVRACHCLKRAGYNTLGELADAIEQGVDLSRLRNCGKSTVREIKEKLFIFQYNSLKQEWREGYLLEVVALNYAHYLRGLSSST